MSKKLKIYASNFRQWLNGSFTCVKCGEQFFIMSFGNGEAICPRCYEGENAFLFHNRGFWLNRVMLSTFHTEKSFTRECVLDQT